MTLKCFWFILQGDIGCSPATAEAHWVRNGWTPLGERTRGVLHSCKRSRVQLQVGLMDERAVGSRCKSSGGTLMGTTTATGPISRTGDSGDVGIFHARGQAQSLLWRSRWIVKYDDGHCRIPSREFDLAP
jgi:hypothetical protein